MKLYKLSYVVRPPDEDEEPDKYIAEIPALPGCRAWGETPAEAIDILHSVAANYLQSIRDHGDPMPPGVEAIDAQSASTGELLLAV